MDYVDIFLQIFKKYFRDYEVAIFFEFLAFFLPALVVLYLQIQQIKNMLIYKSFTKPHFYRPRQDLKPPRLRLEKWEVSRPRSHLETPSLPNMQWGKEYSLQLMQCAFMSEPVMESRDSYLRVLVSKATGLETLNVAKK